MFASPFGELIKQKTILLLHTWTVYGQILFKHVLGDYFERIEANVLIKIRNHYYLNYLFAKNGRKASYKTKEHFHKLCIFVESKTINPKVFRSGDIPRVREETREGKYKDKLCTMCTSGRKPVHHHHFSTSHLRTFAMCWTEGDFMCPVCHKLEPPMQPKEVTKRVILTSSTLFGVWEQHSLPTITQHLEIECIVGGRVRDLTRALKKNLLFLSNRVEIVVVAGINNIGDGQQPNSIVQEMKEMKEVVKQHSQENGHNPPSYVSFSTIILPPTFCSFAVPKDVPE